MGITLLISFLKFLKFTTPLVTFAFIGTWFSQAYDPETFEALDFLLGILPKIMDKFAFVEVTLNNVDITLGYVYAALLTAVICIASIKILDVLEKYQKLRQNREEEREMRYFELMRKHQEEKEKEEKEKREKEKLENETLQKINLGYSLFELDLKYLNPANKNQNNLRKLRNEYSKIIVKKLKEKYSSSKFILQDKVFIIFTDFTIIPVLIKDLNKLYRAILKMGQKQNIQTEILLSFHADNKSASPKMITKLLVAINSLKYYNKVVITNPLKLKFENEKLPAQKFEPLGPFDTSEIQQNEVKEDIELFCLKTE